MGVTQLNQTQVDLRPKFMEFIEWAKGRDVTNFGPPHRLRILEDEVSEFRRFPLDLGPPVPGNVDAFINAQFFPIGWVYGPIVDWPAAQPLNELAEFASLTDRANTYAALGEVANCYVTLPMLGNRGLELVVAKARYLGIATEESTPTFLCDFRGRVTPFRFWNLLAVADRRTTSGFLIKEIQSTHTKISSLLNYYVDSFRALESLYEQYEAALASKRQEGPRHQPPPPPPPSSSFR